MDKSYGYARFDVKPGQEEVFLDKARETMAAAAADLTGTEAYEWFLTPDGRTVYVFEAYDGLDGMMVHIKAVGRQIGELLEMCTSDVMLFGDVAPAIVERMQSKFTTASFFGRELVGRMKAPAARTAPATVSDPIFGIARFAVPEGKLEEIKALARECHRRVEANEPDTWGYEWFVAEDGKELLAIDIYKDPAAMRAHMGNVGPVMAELAKLSQPQVELFGGVPQETIAQLNKGLSVRYLAPRFQGLI